jgi:hypothetical protein
VGETVVTSDDEEEQDVDSGWDLGGAPISEPPPTVDPARLVSADRGTPIPEESPAIAPAAASKGVLEAEGALAPRAPLAPSSADAAPAPRIAPRIAPARTAPIAPRETSKTSPAARASIGLKPLPGGFAAAPLPARGLPERGLPEKPSEADEAPPTVARPMPPPRSRSNTPKVTNAVQKARALDEALTNEEPAPMPRPAARGQGGGMRLPTQASGPPPARGVTPQPMRAVAGDAKPQATALRLGETTPAAPEPTPARMERKATLKLNRATQDFAVKMLDRDVESSRGGIDADSGKRQSAPPLDLHLPAELSLDEPLESIDLARTTEAPAGAMIAAASKNDLDDDGEIEVSVGESSELAPDELAAVDELDDVLDGLIDSLPGAALAVPLAHKPAPTPIPRATEPPRGPGDGAGAGRTAFSALSGASGGAKTPAVPTPAIIPPRATTARSAEKTPSPPPAAARSLASPMMRATPKASAAMRLSGMGLSDVGLADVGLSDMRTSGGDDPGELDLSLDLDEPRSKTQPPSLDPATTRGFQDDDPALTPIRDRIARGDFMGALMRAEALLQEQPDNVGATYFATMCQDKVRALYVERLGSSEGIPHVILTPDAIQALSLDHRSGFLISLIDGIASIDDVLDMSGMASLEALRLLLELKNEGVIGID